MSETRSSLDRVCRQESGHTRRLGCALVHRERVDHLQHSLVTCHEEEPSSELGLRADNASVHSGSDCDVVLFGWRIYLELYGGMACGQFDL